MYLKNAATIFRHRLRFYAHVFYIFNQFCKGHVTVYYSEFVRLGLRRRGSVSLIFSTGSHDRNLYLRAFEKYPTPLLTTRSLRQTVDQCNLEAGFGHTDVRIRDCNPPGLALSTSMYVNSLTSVLFALTSVLRPYLCFLSTSMYVNALTSVPLPLFCSMYVNALTSVSTSVLFYFVIIEIKFLFNLFIEYIAI